MRWEYSHLYEFCVGDRVYGDPLPGLKSASGEVYKAKGIRLNQLMDRGVDHFTYVYDFGDDWRHSIRVESVRDRNPDTDYPNLVEGERQAPPEDVGTLPGFMNFLDASAEPPFKGLLSAVRIAGLFATADQVARVLTPGKITLLTIPLHEDREMVWRSMPELKQAFAATSPVDLADWSRLQPVTHGSDGSGSRQEPRTAVLFQEGIKSAIAKGRPTLALASHPRDLPGMGHVLCEQDFTLPLFTRDSLA